MALPKDGPVFGIVPTSWLSPEQDVVETREHAFFSNRFLYGIHSTKMALKIMLSAPLSRGIRKILTRRLESLNGGKDEEGEESEWPVPKLPKAGMIPQRSPGTEWNVIPPHCRPRDIIHIYAAYILTAFDGVLVTLGSKFRERCAELYWRFYPLFDLSAGTLDRTSPSLPHLRCIISGSLSWKRVDGEGSNVASLRVSRRGIAGWRRLVPDENMTPIPAGTRYVMRVTDLYQMIVDGKISVIPTIRFVPDDDNERERFTEIISSAQVYEGLSRLAPPPTSSNKRARIELPLEEWLNDMSMDASVFAENLDDNEEMGPIVNALPAFPGEEAEDEKEREGADERETAVPYFPLVVSKSRRRETAGDAVIRIYNVLVDSLANAFNGIERAINSNRAAGFFVPDVSGKISVSRLSPFAVLWPSHPNYLPTFDYPSPYMCYECSPEDNSIHRIVLHWEEMDRAACFDARLMAKIADDGELIYSLVSLIDLRTIDKRTASLLIPTVSRGRLIAPHTAVQCYGHLAKNTLHGIVDPVVAIETSKFPKVEDLSSTAGARFGCTRLGSIFGRIGSAILKQFADEYLMVCEMAMERISRALSLYKTDEIDADDLSIAKAHVEGKETIVNLDASDIILSRAREIRALDEGMHFLPFAGVPQQARDEMDELAQMVITHAHFEVPVLDPDTRHPLTLKKSLRIPS